MTIEKELEKIVESISLIQISQAEVPFSEDVLEDFTDYLRDYIPNHVGWIQKGNEKLVQSLTKDNQLDREAISQMIVGLRNLSLDFEELCDILLKLSDEIARKS
ncbi:hypothetical protein D8796_06025 [Streptococcus cristatus]|uniref:Uncharacterized protein n=1 Tax=Streptococcus cristatus TaxID=45634 RepID=A0A3R9LRB4_STRCR|nr:hypothetical protein [Streptococcus cristatus]RSJ79592.1 hypothetical protein D8796_06025 [Streptococcus cristatus]RSJ81627.1 hypothetical protein D8795_00040 [Streptococcus cristatus]RSJ84669.1 hypothetical protein D8794_08535 [Streptococcus cristatus]RSJ86693.1 hypothetical protein D8793_02445 [Streptococcus cristatus]